jgi:chitinase
MKSIMKKSSLVRFGLAGLISLSLSMFGEANSQASSVVLQWNPSTDVDFAGYRVYYKANSAEVPFDGVGAVEGMAPIDVANQTSATITGLDPAANYFFAITAYNTSGMESEYSDIVEIAGINDVTAPSVSFASPGEGATVNGVVTISATASDNTGVSKVEYYQNGVLIAAGNLPPYSYSWDTKSLANGNYTLTAKAYDAAGNVGTSAVVVSVLNDSIAPTVAFAYPTSGGTVSGAVNLSANATDNIAVAKVDFYIGGVLQGSSTSAPYSFNWNTAAVANGTYVLSAMAYDATGNVGQSNNVVVNVSNLNDTTAPAITFLSPTVSYVSSTNVTVSASATDNTAVAQMELYVDGSLKSTTGSSSLSVPVKLSKGAHTIEVRAYDTSKNLATKSMTINRIF